MKVLEKYKQYCEDQNLYFENIDSVKTYTDDTLFCIAGMQKYKDIFLEKEEPTKTIITNNQAVLRYNDIEEINDDTHYAYFNMLGYFDFSDNGYYSCICFWSEFLISLGLVVDRPIMIHSEVYKNKILGSSFITDNLFKIDDSLIWESGTKGTDTYTVGYSTEFYINGVEIGNIVLLENGMIDCGFGLERLEALYNKDYKKPTENQILIGTAEKIIECGYLPKSNGKQEYILWDVLKRLLKLTNMNAYEFINYIVSEKFIEAYTFVKDKYEENQKKYEKLKDKFPRKDKQWWKETHGIYLD